MLLISKLGDVEMILSQLKQRMKKIKLSMEEIL